MSLLCKRAVCVWWGGGGGGDCILNPCDVTQTEHGYKYNVYLFILDRCPQ